MWLEGVEKSRRGPFGEVPGILLRSTLKGTRYPPKVPSQKVPGTSPSKLTSKDRSTNKTRKALAAVASG